MGDGARRWRRRVGVAGLVVAVLAAVAVPVVAGWVGARPGDRVDEVPGRIGLPYMWQATVDRDPPGPAALLVAGDGLGLRGIDLLDHEGKVAVIGRDGRYRMLLYGGAESSAGEDVQLSPDGRYVADALGDGWLETTDLTDGSRRAYDGPADGSGGLPVTWAPDGRSIVALDNRYEPVLGRDADGQDIYLIRLVLLDLDSGATRVLAEERSDRWTVRTASLAAFTPDGSRLLTTVGDTVSLRDRTGRALWSRRLGPRRVLAGSGAVSPDGTRVATVELDGCRTGCSARELGARTWRFGWLDTATGRDTTGPALPPVRGQAVRALGWRTGTDLVALRYEPNPHDGMHTVYWNDTGWWETGHVQLLALRPDGGTDLLLDPPAEVCALDVPRDLLTAGRFGGPAVRARPFPARPIIVIGVLPLLLPLAAAALVLLLWRRRRRAGPVPGPAAVPAWQLPVGAVPARRRTPPDPPWPTA